MSAPTTSSRWRHRLVALVLGTLLVPFVVTAAPTTALADTFDPGMIVSNADFYDHGSMSSAQIDTFLQTKGSACRPGSTGTPCLKDYRQTTWTRAADSACPGRYVGAVGEKSSTIIAKVATACRINPQVLLVLLQKEQSLVTASGEYLTPRRYQAATGYACPDTAPCDAQYSGLYNQLYKAAWQYKRYQLNPYNYGFVAGRANTVRYHPNASCGSTTVVIRNQATAGLYNYTPYVPNSAVLNGRPNSCSSYGNLTFHNLFTSWFPRETYAVTGAIRTFWLQHIDTLGSPTTAERTGLTRRGVVQAFEGGSVYYVPGIGTNSVAGGIATYWGTKGWERGPLGYPTGLERAVGRGVSQTFEGGTVYWSPAGGPQTVLGAIGNRWQRAGGATGSLGFPLGSEIAGPSKGSAQVFQGGVVTWYPGGSAHVIRGGIRTGWDAAGGAAVVGYPVRDEHPPLRDRGVVQYFTTGAIYWTPTYGPAPVTGAILTYYGRQKWENGPLGYPTAAAVTSGSTTRQAFEGGTITYSATTGRVTVTLG